MFQEEAEAGSSAKDTNICTILRTPYLRWPFVLCIAAVLMIPLGGVDIAILYSTGVMQTIGISPQNAPLYTVFIVQLPGLIANCIAILLLLERWGRRPLLLLGCIMSICGTISISLTTPMSFLSTIMSNYLAVVGFSLISVGFSVGPSIVSYLLCGELAPQASRSTTLAFQGAFDFTVAVIVIFGFPPLHQMTGSYSTMPIAILGSVVSFFLYCYLPETKGKEVGDTIKIWMKSDKLIV